MITWWWPQHYSDINDGSQDSLIRARAQAVKAFGSPIFLRPAAEMNGDWFDWGGANNDRDTAAFIKAWRRIHDIFDEEGVHNVSWVWAPNSESSPGGWDPSSWNSWRNYYPGDAYVDWVGIDGYNWGLLPGGDGWLSFGAIMQHVYDDYATRKPIMIAETGSTESGGDKAQWISDMGTWVKAHPAIKAVVYFDRAQRSDWPLDTSPAAAQAFGRLAADPYFSVLAPPPDTTITVGPSGKITTATARFAFVSSEAGSSFQCRLDSASWGRCSSPKSYSHLSQGAHSFHVRARDRGGKTDPSPAHRGFGVDTRVAGAKAFARKVQRQSDRVKVKVELTANERVAARASGEVELGRRKVRLRLQREQIGPGKRIVLALRPRNGDEDETVVQALTHHKAVKAIVKVRFTDEVGNETARRVMVRLR